MAVPHESPEKEYCSTSEAAQRLGLSLGTVQQMVENGQLDGWKTAGGHRRIRVSSIEEFRARSMAGSGAQTQARAPANTLQILVAEDDRILQKLYEHTFSSWGLPLQVRMVSSGIDGLLEIGRMSPDLLITDLRMPGSTVSR
jgi:excisionase family DNA binding protein